MTTNYAIETIGLSRRFGSTLAVDNLDLKVQSGSLCALMGPNGAGKTTLIKILLRMLPPTSGTASVLGKLSAKIEQSDFQRIGYVSENQQLPEGITAAQLFAYCRRIYRGWDQHFCKKLCAELDLPLNRPLGKCSRGQSMKALLISSIAFSPELLIMDEPFSGLDPLTREEFASGLISVAGEGDWSMLISSHDVDDVERIVDHAAIINTGQSVANLDLEKMRADWRTVEVVLPDSPKQQDLSHLPEKWIGAIISGRRLKFTDTAFDPGFCQRELTQRLGAVVEFSSHPLSLRDAYVELAKSWKQSDANRAIVT